MAKKKPKAYEGDPSDPRGFKVMHDSFVSWMRATNYSEKTVENRMLYLGYFFTWCEARAITKPNEVTKQILERYKRYLYHYRKERDGRPLSFRSQHTRLVPIRAFFKYLNKQNLILYNPASELEMPRLGKRLPKHVLTKSEVESILNTCDIETPMGIRARAIIETFYSTGLRRAEITSLNIYDLDTERGTLMVRQGKGGHDRMVPIGERAMAWVQRYLSDVRPGLVVGVDDGTLFLTNTGERFSGSRMGQLVRLHVRKAKIGKQGSCHLFRHTMATLMLEGGADVRFIQAMLGHAVLSTTQIYTQVSIRKLKEIHTATHPAKTERAKPRLVEDGEDVTELYSLLAAEGEAVLK